MATQARKDCEGWNGITSKEKFDFVILCLGANDGLRHLPLPELESNLKSMIDKFKSAGAKVLLIGMKVPPNLGLAYAAQFEKVYSNVAAEKKVEFLPFLLEGVAADSRYNLGDQIHPNKQGHQIIADHLEKFIEPLLK